jgi:hypothetical protein
MNQAVSVLRQAKGNGFRRLPKAALASYGRQSGDDAATTASRTCNVYLLLHAVTHAHAVPYVIAAMTMRDCSTARRDATDAVDAAGTDDGICLSTVEVMVAKKAVMARAVE